MALSYGWLTVEQASSSKPGTDMIQASSRHASCIGSSCHTTHELCPGMEVAGSSARYLCPTLPSLLQLLFVLPVVQLANCLGDLRPSEPAQPIDRAAHWSSMMTLILTLALALTQLTSSQNDKPSARAAAGLASRLGEQQQAGEQG